MKPTSNMKKRTRCENIPAIAPMMDIRTTSVAKNTYAKFLRVPDTLSSGPFVESHFPEGKFVVTHVATLYNPFH